MMMGCEFSLNRPLHFGWVVYFQGESSLKRRSLGNTLSQKKTIVVIKTPSAFIFSYNTRLIFGVISNTF